jgi:hypothetical protein
MCSSEIGREEDGIFDWLDVGCGTCISMFQVPEGL